MVDNCGQIYLQQRLWVDIHLPMFGGHVGNNSEEVAALGGFDDKLPAVGVAQPLVEGGRGAKNVYCGVVLANVLSECLTIADGGCLRLVYASELKQVDEGRELPTAALGQGLVIKRGIILSQASLNHWVLRLICLHHHCSGVSRAPHSSHHLSKQLEDALVSGVIGQGQASVGLHYPNSAQLRQVQSLSHHLCADDDIGCAIIEGLILLLEAACAAVAIKADDMRLGPARGYLCLDELRPNPTVDDIGAVAGGAHRWHCGVVATDMTLQLVAVGVEGERHKAVWALGCPAAVGTERYIGAATAIVKEKNLLTRCKCGINGGNELIRQKAMLGEVAPLGEVDQLNGGSGGLRPSFAGQGSDRPLGFLR